MPHTRSATETIPPYLTHFIASQDYSAYTPIDHASWRYIMRVAKSYFKNHAHSKYLKGLEETGISTEAIPRIESMDQCLRKFGWRAIAVSGFIPPAEFMEFMSLGILPIACEMRKLEHIAYTPAPDIVHEAAGHAPIIADPEYAAYLRTYAESARNAIFSSKDMAVFEAIRNLSDTKEDPHSTPEQISESQKRLDQTISSVSYVSEATYLARMAWWTVEYGLVGPTNNPLIYGAGLLSSVGESYHCLNEKIRKVPLTLDCINMSYDITKPQPQLYVTPDFQTLTTVLEEFTDSMAFRKGGSEGLAKAKIAGTVSTTVLETGLQMSGLLNDFICDEHGIPSYLMFKGPTQLSLKNEQIKGHGPDYHREGFGTPLGLVAYTDKTAADLTESDLRGLGFQPGRVGKLLFNSGVIVEGELKDRVRIGDQNLLLVFENCEVRLGDQILFQPEWGTYDMACGGMVMSVFGGAADRAKYYEATGGVSFKPRKHKSNLTEDNRRLNELSAEIRQLRESKASGKKLIDACESLHAELQKKYPEDWLSRLELLELVARDSSSWIAQLKSELEALKTRSPEINELITRGLSLL